MITISDGHCRRKKSQTKTTTLLHRYRTRTNRLLKKIVLRHQVLTKKFSLPSGIIKHASKYLSGHALDFFSTQLKLANVPKMGRRYSNAQRAFALALYFKSARAYKLLSQLFILPTPKML